MPSSIPGYEYDIFISYRQKDNSYDGWVTAFIENLRKELEATIKHQVFIYVDENKYDGIQEIHHVEESISSKLKCLIFIPIVSQTYCDPECYAWKNEFQIFKEFASTDSVGLKIKLPNGNVTSRIVPVRIHELDAADQALLEGELGAPLRTIDFIFKTPGVNRPLSANEDHPADNQNRLYYRDQINKVANLVKEVILSFKSPAIASNTPTTHKKEIEEYKWPSNRNKIAGLLVMLTLLLLALFYFFTNNLKDNGSPSDNRIAIAVLPFIAIGVEAESQYLADGVMEVILSNLTFFPELKVKSRASVEKYRDKNRSVPEIAEELEVAYILSGSAQKYGDDIRIVVQLVDAEKDVNIWSENFVKKLSNIFEIQNQISESVASYLKARLTAEISDQIKRTPTSDFEAYDLFLQAKQLSRRYESTFQLADLNEAIHLLERAIARDKDFALGYAWLAGLKAIHSSDRITNQQVRDSIILLANRALQIDSTIVEANLVLSQLYNYELDEVNTLRFSYKALEAPTIDSLTSVELVKRLASVYSRIGGVDEAIYLYDKLVDLNAKGTEALHLKFISMAAGRYVDQLEELAKQINDIDPNDIYSDLIMTHVYAERRDYKSVESIYHKLKETGRLDMEILDQYIFIFAASLQKNGFENEAVQLVNQFEEQITPDDFYLLAQLNAFRGKGEVAISLLEVVNIGWYNLTLCSFNPVFEKMRDDARFIKFFRSNSDRIIDQRMRVNQLESNKYLPRPRDFFEKRIEQIASVI